MTSITRAFVLFLFSWSLLSKPVFACAVCFSGASKDMANGFFWGVVILMVLPFGLMGILIGLIVNGARKNRLKAVHE